MLALVLRGVLQFRHHYFGPRGDRRLLCDRETIARASERDPPAAAADAVAAVVGAGLD